MNLSAISKLMDFPVRSQCMSGEEYAEKSKNYYPFPMLQNMWRNQNDSNFDDDTDELEYKIIDSSSP